MLGPQLSFVGSTEVLWEGERYTFFGGNDYHRFSQDISVMEAVMAAVDEYGIGSAGSRATTANHPIYLELEERAAEFFGTEAAATFSAGYLSNAVLLQAVDGEFTHLILDEIAHASLAEAAAQTGLPVTRFRHRDPEHLASLVTVLGPNDKPLVLTDGVFPSSGEIPPFADYVEALRGRPAKLLIDDAHGMATIGPTGKGSWEQSGIPRESVFQTGTLSKGLGGFGGIVVGSNDLIDKIHRRSAAFTGSTPVPMPLAAAALKSIEILSKRPEKISLLQERSLRVKSLFGGLGFQTSPGPGPICSVTFLDAEKNRLLGEALKAAGIYPVYINYPGSPPGGHFRFTMSSAHKEEQITKLIEVVTTCARRLG
jgi:8-amino-7-oxononanoate synthase